MIKRTKSAISLWLFLLLFTMSTCFFSGCKTVGDAHYYRNDIQYGKTRGLFLGRWWDFYERGRSFADGKFWSEAERDLREAVSIRTKDDRRARTYGAHFIQYFGNRELGVVLFRQGEMLFNEGQELLRHGRKKESDETFDAGHEKINKAIYYLKHSVIRDELSDDDILTEKAQYYLKLCYRQLAKFVSDNQAPAIHLDATPSSITNDHHLKLSGWVEDNNYVDKLSINSDDVKLNYHHGRFHFDETIYLKSGLNAIDMEARDSRGNASLKMEFMITLDVDPPVISVLDATSENVSLSIVNEQSVILRKERLENVEVLEKKDETMFRFAPINPAEPLYIEFKDRANNSNGIRIRPEYLRLGDCRQEYDLKTDHLDSTILLASTELPRGLLFLDSQPDASLKPTNFGVVCSGVDGRSCECTTSMAFITDNLAQAGRLEPQDAQIQQGRLNREISSPEIVVQELESLETVYQEYLIISGRINGEFRNFKINDRTKIDRGKDVRFSFKEKLALNKANVIKLEISHVNGAPCERCTKTFEITRRPSPEEIREFRAATVLYPPAKDGGDEELSQDLIWDLMVKLKQNGRFRIAVHGQDIQQIVEKEVKLKDDGWIEASSAARFGKILNAEYSIACSIRPTQDDVEIYARLIDVNTKKTLASCDVYEYSKNAQDFTNAYSRFVDELAQGFPVVEDEIEHPARERMLGGFLGKLNMFSKQGEIILEMGKNANIKEGMKFVAYNRDEPLVDFETGEILVKGRVNKVGELFAKIVGQEFTQLEPIKRLKVNDARFVVSK